MDRKIIKRITVCVISVMLFMSIAQECFADYQTTCSACEGQGRQKCMSCMGTGFKITTVLERDPWSGIYLQKQTITTCSSCNGSGRGIACPQCHGSGQVTIKTGESSSGNTSSEGSSDSKVFRKGSVVEATKGVVSGEEATGLFDNNKQTKWNIKNTKGYVVWKAPSALSVKSYVIMTGNDTSKYSGRNPKSWVLYGSTKKLARKSSAWVKIHSVTNDKRLNAKDLASYRFTVSKNQKQYLYYKLEILSNKGADCTQMSAFNLEGTSASLKATKLLSLKRGTKSITAKWKTVSGITGYQLEYSPSKSFKASKTVTIKKADASSTVIRLNTKETLYFRIRAYKILKGATIFSDWGKAVTAK